VRFVVTGAAGFIGVRLAHRLLDEGNEVVAVDALTPARDAARKRANLDRLAERAGCRIHVADVRDVAWAPLLVDCDAVLHLAGQPGVRNSWGPDFATYVERNVLTTQVLLEALRERPGTRLVLASSSSVYGDIEGTAREDDLPAPQSPYGITKLAAEHLCGAYARSFGVDSVVLRLFTVYGGGQRPDMSVQRMLHAVRSQGTFTVFGDGYQERELTHVADVVDALLAAVSAEVPSGTICNIGGGSSVRLLELIDEVERVVGAPIHRHHVPAAAGDARRTAASIDRSKELLGWAPRVALRSGLMEQAGWDPGPVAPQQPDGTSTL
jgi:nucleoside-diphosphate-sugar epimerase